MTPSRNRKEWRLPLHGDWVVVRSWDVDGDEESLRDPTIPAQLRRWSTDVFYSRVLLDMARTLWGGVEQGRAQKDRWNTLLPRLEDAFRRGTLVLVKRRRTAPSSTGGGAADDADSGADKGQDRDRDRDARTGSSSSGSGGTPRKPKTWVAVRLVDQDGEPVPYEAYKLVLPDGTVQEGNLDDTGEVYVSGIDPGECQISFPNLDQKEWKPA